MKHCRVASIALAGALALALAGALALALACRPAHRWNGVVVDAATPTPELSGTNWDGRAFRLADHRGQVAIVFFGYTYCPDVCPLNLAKMKQLYGRLGDEEARRVVVVFVSVDPKRDSVGKLAAYVPNFDRRFYGLHLDPEQLATVENGFDITVEYSQPKGGPGADSFYYVDHTANFFVFDREGRLRLKYGPNSTAAQLAPDIEALLEG